MDTNQLATMHSYWIAQRYAAEVQERLSGAPDLRLRGYLEGLLKQEEQKLAAIAE